MKLLRRQSVRNRLDIDCRELTISQPTEGGELKGTVESTNCWLAIVVVRNYGN